ncbi:putative pentatricopeptide repeat-containing protein At3g23330 [Impatiens glandulifera]|uniref:putative pentatricopeptide repeat-containing protein At3g23330 n=1 Tax=Impatiens glandulifera TaxID=253017 RepID=UPI001FB0AB9E|nr:putative pentatricopeptide repeat-containing protein At3g23330 [Impatiens glandulifera]
MDFFTNMQAQGSHPNNLTFATILKSCCSMSNPLPIGKTIHARILRFDVAFDTVLENSLLAFYVKCSAFEYAEKVFDSMSVKDTVSWNIMIGVYLQSGDMEKSMDLFRRLNVKDTATWNTVISGHLQNGFGKTSLDLLYQMVQVGSSFNTMTFSIALLLASSMSILQLGLQIHARMLRIGTYFDGFLRNSLVDMYSKCGKMDKASLATNGNLCGSMVIGYLQNGLLGEGLKLFINMFRERVEINEFTLASVVSACANAGLLDFGLQIHSDIVKNGHMMDLFLRSSMIDMYAKNGQLDVSWSVFELENSRNLVLWTSMLSSCASHGDGRKAVGLFEEMLCRGIKPNEVSFLGVLTGCSHAGLLEEGCQYFRLMEEVYGFKPCVDHYMCMVDLFGRAGRFREMKDFVERNSLLGLGIILRSCLSSSLVHKDVEMAKWVSEKLVELEQPCVILSNNFANNNRWEEVSKTRDLMKERGLNKQLARSWVAT